MSALCRFLLRVLCGLIALAWLCGAAMAEPAAAQGPHANAGPGPRPRILSPIDPAERVELAGHRSPALANATDEGAVEDNLRLERLVLMLRPDTRQAEDLSTLIRQQHNPRSTRYRQWLSPQAFEARFGIHADDVNQIAQWLQEQGLTVEERPRGGRSLIFSGTAAQLRAAFGMEMHYYCRDDPHAGALNGKRHIANASEPSIPKALADVIEGMASLNDIYTRPLNVHQPVPGPVQGQYTSGSTHYLAPADFRVIYNLNGLAGQSINGSGRSIAIVGRSNIALSDISQFRSTMGLPSNPPQVIVNGTDPGYVNGDEGESDLDIEWAGAVAPNATIKFVTSASTGSSDGIALSAQYAVSNNVADIISVSYGLCERLLGASTVNYYNNLWQQAAAQGISVVVSSGDSGAADCDAASASTATGGAGVNGLCTSPYSTCVGGTQFNDTANPSQYWAANHNGIGQSALSYIPELVWNESGNNGGTGLWATGGGASTRFSKPSWQNTPGVPSDGKRDVPDVSLTAATHDGYLVYSSDNSTRAQTLYVFGGTSASAPAFAGILALTQHKTGYRLGQANPTLYGLANLQASGGRAYFHSITSGNNSVPGQTGFSASPSTPYFNKATGLGSVDGDILVNHWTDTLPASTTTLSSNTTSTTVGSTVTLTATVTGTSPTGTVQFMDNGSALGSPVALGNGSATYSTNTLAVGTHTLAAQYSGNSSNQGSTSSSVTVAVNKAATSTSLSSSANPSDAGTNLTLTAAVSGGVSPTGTVTFLDGSATLGTVSLNGPTATLTLNTLEAGTHTLTATYSGDDNNTGSTSGALSQSINAASPTQADGDVPTLPEWGTILLGLGLIWTQAQARRHTTFNNR